jgi:CDP-diglyceride synthetase
MSCLSLFLEVFGHLFISLPSAAGYVMYTCQNKYIVIVLILSVAADFGRQEIGVRFGSRYFAKHVVPEMRLEGAILCILTPMLASYFMAKSGYFINISAKHFMWLGHITGFLSLISFMIQSFLKRCSQNS